MEPSLSRTPDRRGFWSGRRTFLLASLSFLVLAGALGALFLPRLLLSPSVKHPPLLKTSSAVQGNLTPFWLNEHTVLLESPGNPHYQWNLSGTILHQLPQRTCNVGNSGVVGASTGIYAICMSDTGALQVVNMLTGVTTLDYNDHLNHSWSPFTLNKEKTRLAALSEREVLQIWDLQTGRSQLTLQLPPTDDQRITLAWSPDGRMLAVNYRRRNLQIWNLAGRRLLYNLVGPGLDGYGELAWSSDSTHLGYVTTDSRTLVDIWDMRTGRLSMTDRLEPFTPFTTFQLLAGGQSFLLKTADSNQVILVNALTRHVLLSQSPSIQPLYLQISPDTQLLELNRSGSNTIDVYDAVTGQKAATYSGLAVQGHFGALTFSFPMLGSWSPDSRSIASAGQDGRLYVWNARTGQNIASYALRVAYASEITWSPGGDMIALITAPSNPGTPDPFNSKSETAYIVSAP